MQLTFGNTKNKTNRILLDEESKLRKDYDFSSINEQSIFKKNAIYLGDNLDHLRSLPTESVDFSYNDPPWNTKKEFNAPVGTEAEETQFIDNWFWDDVKSDQFWELTSTYPQLAQIIGLINDTKKKKSLKAYLVMIAMRLIEIHRVLKKTGTVYIHCDPNISSYLKLILDAIFGKSNFRNEIIWRRFSGLKPVTKNLPKNADIILRYTKSDLFTWNQEAMYLPHDEISSKRYNKDDYDGRGRYALDHLDVPAFDRPKYELLGITAKYSWTKEKALQGVKDGIVVRRGNRVYYKNYLNTSRGKQLDTIWLDIPCIGPRHVEATGYPTQKPLKLLTRLIEASSNPGDVVLDAFCGSGTTCIAAEILHRRWIGIDVGTETIKFIKKRFESIEDQSKFWNANITNLVDYIDYIEEPGPPFESQLPVLNPENIPKFREQILVNNKKEREDNPIIYKFYTKEIYKEQAGLCNCEPCSVPLRPQDITIDHIDPNGPDEKVNLQILCWRCNMLKGTRSMSWLTKAIKKKQQDPNIFFE